MRYRLILQSVFTLIATVSCGLLFAQELTGRAIMVNSRDADSSLDSQRSAMMLIERGNKELVRKLILYSKKYGEDERSLTRFIEPADVRDTQFLSWTYEDIEKDDDLWVFFPSENLIRRISGGGKKGSFMRSDFANEDIEQRAVDDDTHTLIERTDLNGNDVYLVESIPIPQKAKDSGYAKRRLWIDANHWIAHQIEFYDKRGRLLKRLNQGGIEKIDGIWTATKLIMETPRKKSRTLMQYTDVSYNNDLDDDFFEQSALKR